MYYIPSYYDNYYYPVDQFEALRRQKAYEHARRQALERQHREEILRRRLYEEERARRAREEEMYRERLMAEQERRLQEDEDEYVTVIGPDGYPYGVHRRALGMPAMREERTAQPSPSKKVTIPVIRKNANVGETQSVEGATFMTPETVVGEKKPKKKKKITVIVEDASDDETESDKLESIWRNRHPGPGESWMEPVNAAF